MRRRLPTAFLTPRTSKELFQEVATPGYIGRARARAQFRKSPWNLLLVPIGAVSFGLITYALFKMMWELHTVFYPAHTGRLGEFWGVGVSKGAFISSFLLLTPLLLAAIPLCLMVANCIGWCILPARRAFEREAQAAPWLSFRVAMSQLWLLSLYIVPICLLLSLIGAATLKSLK